MPRITQAEYDIAIRERDMLKRQLDDRRREPGDLPVTGCGDSGCMVVSASSRGGQHTNGGCRCEAFVLRRAMMYWKRVAAFREELIRELREGQSPDDSELGHLTQAAVLLWDLDEHWRDFEDACGPF
jgi:hypothetical protein